MQIVASQLLNRRGVWLLAARRGVRIRDGIGHSAPMRDVPTDQPVYFRNLSAAKFMQDKDVFVIPDLAPPEGVSEAETAEERVARLQAELAAAVAELPKKPAPAPAPAAPKGPKAKAEPKAEPKPEVEPKAAEPVLDAKARLEAELGG